MQQREMEKAELQRQIEEAERQLEEEERAAEQYFADKEEYNKKGCIGKACTRVKRFLTGKPKLRKGGKSTRKIQRKARRN